MRPVTEQPAPIDLVHELHEAVYGYSCARPEAPKAVWEELLTAVRAMAAGQCGACVAGTSYVAARDRVDAADGKALMDAVWHLDAAWHDLRVAVGAPCESEDCGCELVGVPLPEPAGENEKERS